MSARRKRRWWLWLLGLLLTGAVVFVVLQQNGAGSTPIDPALVVTVTRGNLAIEILETGKVEARETVELKAKVAGEVAKVLVEEGDQVKKDQLLLVLDPTDYQREVAHAQAELAKANAAVGFAKIVLERKTAGVAGNVTPAHELDAAKYDLKDRGLAVELARVALSAAQDRLHYTKIHSPLTGTVLQRGIEPGEVVTPGVQSTFDGKALLVVADLTTLVVEVDLNQIDVAKVRLGQTATLTLDALPGKTYDAKITKIAPAAMRVQGREVDVFPVKAELTVVDGLIKPGMTADVRIRLEEKVGVLSLPIDAVVEEKGKASVWRVIDGADKGQTTEKLSIALGARNDRMVEVVSGVEEGNRILINPPSAAANETEL